MLTEEFNYDLPIEFIAQTPVEPRDHSRLLVLKRHSEEINHRRFYEIGEYLKPGDLLVINKTRVIPARLYGKKLPGEGRVEVLLLRKDDTLTWECLVGGSGLGEGRRVRVDHGPEGKILEVLEGSKRIIQFSEPIEAFFDRAGHVPLPPYIHNYEGDPERYQTVYNKIPGSAAAPTAGLHFTSGLMERLKQQGVNFSEILLHVGLDTFAPVTEANPETHLIHREWCEVEQSTAELINQTRQNNGRIIAVGTTSVRTLESAGRQSSDGKVAAWSGETNLYILPGYKFKLVDGMVTNFHLPKSTLLMLVSAFAGRQTMLSTYEIAKKEGYRFFSFGDAMLLI